MPFNDPHTAAPSLWAWRDAAGYQFECSAAPLTWDTRTRLAMECRLLWQHRLEHGVSTLCNYGRFHAKYTKSGDRRTGRRGGRLPAGEVNPAGGTCTTALQRHGKVLDSDWMGLAWTPWHTLDATKGIAGAGLYRISDGQITLLYIGESLTLASRLRSHARRARGTGTPWVSVVDVGSSLAKYQLHELECDLIAGYFDETGFPPAMQFLDGRLDDAS